MSVSRKISVQITNKKILKIPYNYLIFQLGQIKILGQADTCLFSTKNMAFTYQIYGKNRDFLVFRQIFFCPILMLKNKWYSVFLFCPNQFVTLWCVCSSLLKWGKGSTFLVITEVQFFWIELKSVKRVSADANPKRFQHKVL